MGFIKTIALSIFLFILMPMMDGKGLLIAGNYPMTIEALQERYADEIVAHRKYNMYAKQACNEGYPNIAHLFKALASSEAIHGRNFKNLLQKLGATTQEDNTAINSGNTRSNLKQAATVERDEIDKTYPDILDQIKDEDHKEAIRSITYAWKAENQHRELIIKIQKASSSFFGMLVKKIEGDDSHFHICQVCGSTLLEKPTEKCPICSHSGRYKEVTPYAENSCQVKN